MINEIKNYFNSLQNTENWFRFGKTFATKNKKYFLDTGTGKIFIINDSVYKILDCITRTNDFENIKRLSLSDEELKSALDEIKEAVENEHILSALPVKTLVGPQNTELEKRLDNKMQSITLELTEKCNLRCKYCIYGKDYSDYRNFGTKEMSIEVAKKAVDFLIEHHGDEEFHVGFYGGEPLLCFDKIKEIVSYVKEKYHGDKIYFSMTSNMTLMTKEMAEYFANVGNFTIMCSIDGPEFIHNENRVYVNGKGTFNDAIRGVKYVAEAYKGKDAPPILFSVVLNPPYSKERFNEIQDFFSSLEWLPSNSTVQISYVSYETVPEEYIPINDRTENQFEYILEDDIDPLEEWSLDKSEKNNLFSEDYIKKPFLQIHKRRISDTPIKNYGFLGCCVPGARKAFITTTGDILPCERIGTVPPVGNVFDGFNIKHIKKYYVDEFIKESIKVCGECWAINICSNCYMDCFDKNGKIDFSYKNRLCRSTRKQIHYDLICYHELLEKDPELINKLNNEQMI